MADDQTPLTLQNGDFGILIRANGSFDLLVPGGQEGNPLNSLQKAMLGAAVSIFKDEETLNLFEARYLLETRPAANKVAA